jgi:hypothetical protein
VVNFLNRFALSFIFLLAISFGVSANEALNLGELHSEANIKVDGLLNEAVWASAETVQAFQLVDPPSLINTSLNTQVKMLATAKGLYVAFINEQAASKHLKRISGRDASISRDSVMIAIDSEASGINGKFFELALGDSKSDGVILSENEFSYDWNGPWSGASVSDANQWVAEMFLPWSMFSFSEASKGHQNFNFYLERNVAHLGETWAWPALPEGSSIFLSGFQKASISELPVSRGLEVYPYLAGNHDFLNHDNKGDAGLDLFWQQSTSTQIAMTLNPDFAQIESDELEINLTSFETSFPEKRAFFLERQEVFDSGKVPLVHTRRIGGKPERHNNSADAVSGFPSNSDIDFATKISGKQNSVQYAWLAAQESDSEYEVNDLEAEQSGRTFNAFRLLAESKGDTYKNIGWLATVKDHEDREAVVHSLDSRLRSRDGNRTGSFQVMQSRTERFFDSVSTENKGYGATFEGLLNSEQGDRHYLSLESYDDEFDVSDMGFLRRNEYYASQYSFTRNTPGFRNQKNLKTYFYLLSGFNLDDRLVFSTAMGRWTLTTQSQHFYEMRLQYNPARWEDRLGPIDYKMYDRPEMGFIWKSDSSQSLSSELALDLRTEGTHHITQEAIFTLNYLPSPRISLQSKIKYTRLNSRIQYLPNEDRSVWCLCTVDAENWGPVITGSYFFSAKQQISLSAQSLSSKAFTQQAWQVGNHGKLLRLSNDVEAFNYNRHQMAVQLKYRQEVAPLSDLFLVYSRKSDIDDSFETVSENLTNTFEEPFEEKLTLKLRYRLSN